MEQIQVMIGSICLIYHEQQNMWLWICGKNYNIQVAVTKYGNQMRSVVISNALSEFQT